MDAFWHYWSEINNYGECHHCVSVAKWLLSLNRMYLIPQASWLTSSPCGDMALLLHPWRDRSSPEPPISSISSFYVFFSSLRNSGSKSNKKWHWKALSENSLITVFINPKYNKDIYSREALGRLDLPSHIHRSCVHTESARNTTLIHSGIQCVLACQILVII